MHFEIIFLVVFSSNPNLFDVGRPVIGQRCIASKPAEPPVGLGRNSQRVFGGFSGFFLVQSSAGRSRRGGASCVLA
jgi:hypothetical protein